MLSLTFSSSSYLCRYSILHNKTTGKPCCEIMSIDSSFFLRCSSGKPWQRSYSKGQTVGRRIGLQKSLDISLQHGRYTLQFVSEYNVFFKKHGNKDFPNKIFFFLFQRSLASTSKPADGGDTVLQKSNTFSAQVDS